jgi:hypothetical protein
LALSAIMAVVPNPTPVVCMKSLLENLLSVSVRFLFMIFPFPYISREGSQPK